MNKNAIKKFAIGARSKLLESVKDKAGMLGITPNGCSEPIVKGSDFEVYMTAAGTEVTLNLTQCKQREKLVSQIVDRGFDAVVEEVAYTWFNRICAIRFMEINDYLPTRVRVLSSEKEGKTEPDLVTLAPDVDLNFTEEEREDIFDCKLNGRDQKMDGLFSRLFMKQCNQLSAILPELFEETEDYTELLLNISYTNKDGVIYMLVNPDTGIPEEDFNVTTVGKDGKVSGQVEIIGWLYQYYNTELKDDTFAKLKKNIKISKDRIPAATQLFTPDWIVRYMVENSVGRIWIEHLRANNPAVDEKEMAEKFGWKYYLPEAEQGESVNLKLTEIRKDYKDLKPIDITCIDPCMGSGHILMAMFDVLMDIYKSVGYSERDAAFEIVEHNIYGLDIDKRAYQLSYFAVMMKGRGYNRRFLRGKDGVKVQPKLYAIKESGHFDADGQKRYVFDDDTLAYFVKDDQGLKRDMELIVDVMFDAREYGSVLKVPEVNFEKIFDRFKEIEEDISLFKQPVIKKIYPIVSMAYMLAKKYDVVVTNPPYMGASGMDGKLSKYVKDNYPDSKSDLFAVFIEKCGEITKHHAFQAMITQHAWMFLSSFEKLRGKLLLQDIVNMAHLGARAFEEIGGEVVQTTSFVMRKSHVEEYQGTYCRLIEPTTQQGKEDMFLGGENQYIVNQGLFEEIPGNPVAYWVSINMLRPYADKEILFENIAVPCAGLATGDNNIFQRVWYEVEFNNIAFGVTDVLETEHRNEKWYPCNSGGNFRKWSTDDSIVVNWKNDGEEIKKFRNSSGKLAARPQNTQWYFKRGLTWNKLSTNRFAVKYKREGYIFDDTSRSAFPDDLEDLYYIIGLLCSNVALEYLKVLNPTMSFTNGDLIRIPVILERKGKRDIEDLVSSNINMSKAEWDSFETSWDFKTHPFLQMNRNSVDTVGSVVTRISDSFGLWKAYTDIAFEKLKHNEEELNRIFIDIYGLQDELTPEEDDKDVTIRKADLGRDIRSFISYAVGCMFGRYSLAKEGLMFAGGKMTDVYQYHSGMLDGSFKLNGRFPMNGKSYYYLEDDDYLIDGDNIIPITDEEYFSDDIVSRFVEFVKIVYGEETLEENLRFIADALGNKGDTSREVIRNYFLKDFYADHLKVYQKRPIYWLFDSGKQNGFKALIYMHRYDVDTVGRVRIDYLHKAQKYVETAMSSAQYTIDNSASASEKSKATKAVAKYTKQLAEMKIYDEAIAHVTNQRIEIDLDDGVKVNYAKFQGVEVSQEGKKAIKVNLLTKI